MHQTSGSTWSEGTHQSPVDISSHEYGTGISIIKLPESIGNAGWLIESRTSRFCQFQSGGRGDQEEDEKLSNQMMATQRVDWADALDWWQVPGNFLEMGGAR